MCSRMCGSCPRICGLNPRLIYLQRVSNNSFLKLNYLKDIFHETMAVLPSGGDGGWQAFMLVKMFLLDLHLNFIVPFQWGTIIHSSDPLLFLTRVK